MALFGIYAISSDATKKWYTAITGTSWNTTSFWTVNDLLSFGGTRNDVLAVMTNEDTNNSNQVLL